MINKTRTPWVLVAEDEASLTRAYQAMFEYHNIKAVFVSDGEDALRELRGASEEEQPSAVLLDLIIPKKNGFEVLKEMHSNNKLKNIPVIVLTNLAQKADRNRADELGAVEYLIKDEQKLEDVANLLKKYLSNN